MRLDKQIKGDIITVLVTSILIFSFLSSNYLLLYLSLGLLIVNVIWLFLKNLTMIKIGVEIIPIFIQEYLFSY